MVAILYPRRLRELRDVTQPGVGLPDQGVPQLQSSNSSFVVETIAAGNLFSLGASNLGNTLGDTGVTGTQLVLAGIGRVTLSQSTDAAGGTITISGGTAGVGAFSGGVSNLGNTLGTTGITGTQVVFAGGNSITLSQSVDGDGGTITIVGPTTSQSVQTQGRFDLTAAGNTAGVLALVSSGTLTLAGGTNITLSQNGNAITISGATTSQSVQPETQTFVGGISASNTLYTSGTVNMVGSGIVTVQSGTGQRVIINASQSVQPETQTFVAGIIASDTTYTSGSIRFTGVGGGVTVSSNTGQRVDISVAAPVAQTVQTQNVVDVTLSGNTSGALALISSGTMTLAGGNNITVSQAGNAITISGPNVGGAQTGISGIIASDATYTSGTVQFTGSNMITVKSSAGQRVVIDATQSVQPGVQNIVASDATFSSGTVSISGFGAVTVNTAANLIRISAPVQSVQPETQTFIGGISASDTLYTSGTVRFTGVGGGVTVSSNTNQRVDISVAAPVAQTGTQFSAGLSNIGNTAGDTGTVAGRVVLAGGNNITLSGSTNGVSETITISAGAGGGFSGGVSNVGNTSGDTGITGSRLVFAGGNSITLSQSTNASGGTITVSAPNASLLSAVAPLSTSTNGSTISILGPAQLSVGFSTMGNTSGNTGLVTGQLALVGSNGITLSGSTNAGSQTITISGVTQSAESQSIGMSNLGNTSGTTGIASGAQVRMLFAGGNNVTLSQSLNGASGTITISAFNQTGTQFSAGISGGNTSGDTGTVGGRVVFAGGNNITLSGSTNGVSETISISAFTQSVESQSIGMSNIGNTSGTTGIASGGQVRFLFAGGNNITLSQSLNGASGTITISAPNLGAGAMSAGVSNLGNTAGATGVTGTRLVLVGSDNITLSQTTDANGGTVSFVGGAGGGFSAGVSTGGNTAGATGVSGTRMVLVGTNAISLSQTTGAAGNTVSIDAPATSSLVGANGITVSTNGSTISVMPVTVSSLAPYDESPMVTGQQGQATMHLSPFRFPNIQFDRIVLGIQVSNATNSSGSFTLSQWVGIYTKNVNTLSLVSSTSISTNFSGSGTAGSYSLYGGPRNLTIPWTMTLTGSDYWMGINSRTTSGGADVSVSQLLLSKFTNVAWSGLVGAASNASDQRLLGLGVFSVSTAGIPASVAFTDIRGTGSIVLREPIFQLRSGTV